MATNDRRREYGFDADEVEELRAEVGVLREALTALLAATEPVAGFDDCSEFWDAYIAARAAAAAVVEQP